MKKLILLFILISAALPIFAQRIKTEIDHILRKVPPKSNYGILIINPMKEDTIYAHNVNTPLIPASNTKLFTTAVAIYFLGPEYPILCSSPLGPEGPVGPVLPKTPAVPVAP